MPIPKFHEIMLPLLELYADKNEHHRHDFDEKITEIFGLSESDMQEKVKSGWSKIQDRIDWASTFLKKAKLLETTKRGYYKITQRGLDVLDKKLDKLTSNTLKNLFPDIMEDRFWNPELREKTDKIGNPIIMEIFDQTKTPQDLLDEGVRKYEQIAKSDLIEKLKTINPYFFEKVILKLLDKMGYGDTIETKKSGDAGIDGIVNQDKLGLDKIYIQAKRYNENKVREYEVRNFIGAMSGDTTKGIFVTTSTFDQSAILKAKEAHHKIILIDGDKLVDLMYNYGIGVQTKDIYEIRVIDSDFFEL